MRLTALPNTQATLSYRIPPHLTIEAGQLVWVPLQNKQVQGIVLAVEHQQSGDFQGPLRDVTDVTDPVITIPPAGLQLAHWLAATYRMPLYDALSLLLPPGVRQQAIITWQATPAGLHYELGELPVLERALLYTLRIHGELPVPDLHNRLRSTPSAIRKAGATLRERGLIQQGSRLSVPQARPSIERMVTLTLDPATLEAAIAARPTATRQHAVLRWLATQPDRTAPLTEVYAAVHPTYAMIEALVGYGQVRLFERERQRDPLAHLSVEPDQPPPLTRQQAQVWQPIQQALADPGDAPPVFLLHGVTGSGKTEIYLRAVARALRLGRQALVLVPEIALTTQLVRRFAARFAGQLAVLHSNLSMGERYDTWRMLRRGEARVLIGSRSAVFAPLPDLGLVILDEEHEPSFKQDSNPRYHAREVALQLAQISGSVAILGSATPAIESYYAAKQGHYTLLEMSERVGSSIGADGLPVASTLPLPPVRLVDMRQELQQGNSGLLSRALHTALHRTLERGEQAILFLNRRGAASFVMCRDCGLVLRCPRCAGNLTVHYADDDSPEAQPTLICHTCNRREAMPAICPQCLSPRIKGFGVGTQRVEAEVQQLFPQARLVRWDSDTARGKAAYDVLLDQFLRHDADVLIGTQMIAKGFDLPHVALVGVVAGDMGLHLPDFRSAERTFQLLTQVAGRAGRRSAGAQVIIQTYDPTHYALRAAQEHDYHGFYVQEIAFRRQLNYPPYSRIIRCVYASSSRTTCEREAMQLASRVQQFADQHPAAAISLIGPAPAFIERMRGRWRWHLLIRTRDPATVLDVLGTLPGWLIDVDPVHLL